MKVSIITVCYNSSRYISSAIESVLSQSHADIEYIIIDGGSTDNTLKLIENHPVSIVISEPDKGIYDAMNKGINLASGEVIGILNSDDFYLDNNIIEKVVKTFQRKPSAEMVMGNVDFVSPSNIDKPIRLYSSSAFKLYQMKFGFMPAHPATFVKKTAYERVGLYNISYKIAADFDWFVRALILKRLSFVSLNKTLIRMRLGGVSSSGFKSYILITKEMLASLKENKIYSNIFFVLSRLPIKYFKMKLHLVKSYFFNVNC